MNKYRWFIWGGVGVAALIAALLIAINASLHTLRSTGKAVAKAAGQVAFINLTNFANRKSSGDVYLINADSGELTQLTSGEEVRSLEWSPDGESLYLVTRSSIKSEYSHRLDVTTGTLTPLTGDEQSRKVGMYTISVSPDGRQITYDTAQTFQYANGKVVVAALDGSSPREIGAGGMPQWSPDGKRIVYVRGRANGSDTDNDIYVMAADGSDVQKVAALPAADILPGWTPDGKTIVFASLKRDEWGAVSDGNLYRVDPDGKNLVRLGEVIEPYMLRVLPDGKAVYTYGSGGTCVTPIDGGKERCKFTSESSLSPDGTRVIMSLQDSLSPFAAPTNVRLCLGLIDGASLTDGRCVYSTKTDLLRPRWRPD